MKFALGRTFRQTEKERSSVLFPPLGRLEVIRETSEKHVGSTHTLHEDSVVIYLELYGPGDIMARMVPGSFYDFFE